jgi:spoIIIJ-associated protein
MEEPLEFTGETVDAAIASGLEQLNAKSTEVLVEVLEEPSRGVFGIGARPARVRLKLMRSSAPPAPVPPIQEEAPVQASAGYAVDEDYDDEFGVSDSMSDDDGEVARAVLLELLDKMNMRAQVTIQRGVPTKDGEEAPFVLDVTGTDATLLIGRRGETLAALQYITRLITIRRLQRRANVVVDSDGYKSRRMERLEQLAVRMADEAVETGRIVTLEPMPANERRIIHMTLRERPDVETRSSGEGDSRKVTIVPL